MSLLNTLINLKEGSVKDLLANFNDAVFDEVYAKLEAIGMSEAEVERAVNKAEDNEKISSITWNAQEAPRDLRYAGTISDYADRVIAAMKKSRIIKEDHDFNEVPKKIKEIEEHLQMAIEGAKKLIYTYSASMSPAMTEQITKTFIPGITSFISGENQIQIPNNSKDL